MDNARMEIVLNGQTIRTADGSTLQQLLEAQQLAAHRVAVEVNATIVPRSQYTSCRLHAGDQVEIVHALGGG